MNRLLTLAVAALLVGSAGGTAAAVESTTTFRTTAPSTTTPGERIGFQANLEANVTGLEYIWDFDDGSTGTGWYVSNTYDEPGTYAVVVTAKKGGFTRQAVVTVTVVPEEGIDIGTGTRLSR